MSMSSSILASCQGSIQRSLEIVGQANLQSFIDMFSQSLMLITLVRLKTFTQHLSKYHRRNGIQIPITHNLLWINNLNIIIWRQQTQLDQMNSKRLGRLPSKSEMAMSLFTVLFAKEAQINSNISLNKLLLLRRILLDLSIQS